MRFAAVVAVLAAAGCAENQVLVPAVQRAGLERQLVGTERYLKLSYFQLPFFGDATKKLVAPVLPDEVRMLDAPDGTPVSPGSVEKIFPVGTRVRLKGLEFPTPLAMTGRVLITPRYSPWVFLDIAGTPRDSPPFVLVLRMNIKTDADFLTELDRYLATDDPSARLSQWPPAVVDSVKSKQAVVDMPADALEMAWGYPERKEISFEGDRRKEVWRWPGGRRTAVLLDGKVSDLP